MIALKDIKDLVRKHADKFASSGLSAEDREDATGRQTDDRYPISLFHQQMVRDLCEIFGAGQSVDESLVITLTRLFVEHEQGGTCLKLEADDFRPDGDSCEEYLHLEHREKGDYLYLRRDWECELTVREKVKDLSAGSTAETSHAAEFVFGQTEEKTTGWSYGADQIAAVKSALANRFTIITGGPGTGKTTVVFAVLAELIKRDPAVRIALAAPTGKAAQRMGESIADSAKQVSQWPDGFDGNVIKERLAVLEGTTYHRLLHYTPVTNSFTYNADNPLPYDVLVVDEASMIDLVHARDIFSAIGAKTRHVILLGDPNQLPSVDEGSVLSDLLSDEWRNGGAYISKLEEAKRFSDPMKTLVTKINEQTDGVVSDYEKILDDAQYGIMKFELSRVMSALPGKDKKKDAEPLLKATFEEDDADSKNQAYVYLAKSTEDASKARQEIKDLVESWQIAFGRKLTEICRKYSGSKDEDEQIRKVLRSAQVLTVVRKGAWGCEGINRQLIKMIHNKEPEDDISGVKPYAGLPIIITKNDKLLGLNNGDVGVVVGQEDDDLKVWIDGYTDREKADGAGDGLLPYRILPAYEPAYAITIHKSQGSQYDNVLVVLPPKKEDELKPWSPLMTKELVYTGITRAKKRAFVYGSREGFLHALSHRSQRQTGRL